MLKPVFEVMDQRQRKDTFEGPMVTRTTRLLLKFDGRDRWVEVFAERGRLKLMFSTSVLIAPEVTNVFGVVFWEYAVDD